jgi:lipoprotein-anchoring transpeptidase ErfK/SrfK
MSWILGVCWAATAFAQLSEDVARLAAQREQLRHAVERVRTPEQRKVLLEQLGRLQWALLCDPRWTEEKVPHQVAPGDTLNRIARRYRTTSELLAKSNRICGDRLNVGDILWVPTGTVELVVDKSANTLTVFRNGKFFCQYRVATGVNNCTPVGEFTITERVERPTWWRPEDNRPIPYGDPEHELGTHWLAWSLKGFGIHGTNKPESIGTQASRGCVRMRNEDVAEVFALAPVGTRVRVVESLEPRGTLGTVGPSQGPPS